MKETETTVIYNGLPIAVFDRADHKLPHRSAEMPFVIGMVARLEGHKDQPTLIRAARILKMRARNIGIWLIGEGSRRQEFERLAEAEDVTDIVEFLGMRKDVAELTRKMHLFAFSTTPDEGLGIALIEAMTASVPIVATDVGACREVLDNGRLGTLVAPSDPLALADAIDAVIADADSADALARLARQKVLQAFSITDMAHRYAVLLGLSSNETQSCKAEPKLEFTC